MVVADIVVVRYDIRGGDSHFPFHTPSLFVNNCQWDNGLSDDELAVICGYYCSIQVGIFMIVFYPV